MGTGTYIPLFNTNGAGGGMYTPSFGGGETAGSVANNGFSSAIDFSYYGGETAGSVASSSGGSSCCSSCGCSFSAIA